MWMGACVCHGVSDIQTSAARTIYCLAYVGGLSALLL